MMDLVVGLANQLTLTDYSLHLASRIIDGYLAQQDKPVAPERLQIIGATCLKIADVFAEQSKEYYKQENAVEYAEATMNLSQPFHATSEQMLTCEKEVLPSLNFDLHMPTAHWFVQCYLVYARFTPTGSVAKTASFIGDLTLLDYELLRYPPSLRAQCIMLVAVFLVQQAKQQGRGSTLRRTPSAAGCPPPAAEPKPPALTLAFPMVPPLPGSSDASSSATAPPEQPSSLHSVASRGGGGLTVTPRVAANGSTSLTYLEHWDRNVRDHVCRENLDIDVEMCLQAVVRMLTVMRREWKTLKLAQVENKHGSLARTLVYPERFPVSKLVCHLLPGGRQHRDEQPLSG